MVSFRILDGECRFEQLEAKDKQRSLPGKPSERMQLPVRTASPVSQRENFSTFN